MARQHYFWQVQTSGCPLPEPLPWRRLTLLGRLSTGCCCRVGKAQQDLASNHRDTVGSAMGGDYMHVSGQSALPAAEAAAQRQVANSYLLDCPVMEEDSVAVQLEARVDTSAVPWRGIAGGIESKRTAAKTYTEMGRFNKLYKDVAAIPATKAFLAKRLLRCLPQRLQDEGEGYVLVREGHPGVRAVLQDPNWPQYEQGILALQQLQDEHDARGVVDVGALLQAARALPRLTLLGSQDETAAAERPLQPMALPAAPAATAVPGTPPTQASGGQSPPRDEARPLAASTTEQHLGSSNGSNNMGQVDASPQQHWHAGVHCLLLPNGTLLMGSRYVVLQQMCLPTFPAAP
jgi:hypothetical protein